MSPPLPPAEQLTSGLKQLNLTVSESVQATLLAFLDVLLKWNKVHNLTAITDLPKMITHHLLDSLSIAPYCTGSRILDIGSGAGFPGIPLALVFPEKSFVLLDSSQKKTAFLIHAKAHFKIPNVEVVCARVEEYKGTTFDTIISRAFGTLSEIIQKTKHLLNPQGHWLIMKGTYPQQELTDFKLPYSVHRLSVPGLDAERHLMRIQN